MSKMKTKRRKVWVMFDAFGPCAVFTDRARALALALNSRVLFDDPRLHKVAISLVEVHPGDVVLSREDAEELRAVVSSPLLLTGQRDRALALLRGRR